MPKVKCHHPSGYSRKKRTEIIRDEVDAFIYDTFTIEQLKLDKYKWSKLKKSLPNMTDKQELRLKEIRRMMRSRVYAENKRRQRKSQMSALEQQVDYLLRYTAQLTARIEELEVKANYIDTLPMQLN